jgi:hypothetical protein
VYILFEISGRIGAAMFSETIITRLKRFGWAVFFIVLGLETVNLVYREKAELYHNRLPFEIRDSVAVNFTQAGLDSLFAGKVVTRVDTLVVSYSGSDSSGFGSKTPSGPVVTYMGDRSVTVSIDDDDEVQTVRDEWQEGRLDQIHAYIQGRSEVQVTLKDPQTGAVEDHTIVLEKELDTDEIYLAAGLLLLLIFTFFNSYLLLRYSLSKENILIVYFLIFLVSPSLNYLPVAIVADIWGKLISPFWGIFFYHFIVLTLQADVSVKKLYVRSLIIYAVVFGFGFFEFAEILEIVLYLWPTFWILKAILMLRREYRRSQKIEYRRLLSAFSGLSISGIGIAIILGGAILLVTVLPGVHLLINSDLLSKIIGASLGISVVIGVLTVFIGILWFFGSFTWSLLTGTALGVKIRSTLIYTIIGIVFVTVFGLIDYSLGELLQYLFGKFVGSEFIAGIPGTIVLISLFVPIRNKVERLVDNKLNTSELDFLERTDTFTQNLTNEGVVEGFEEYICENLIEQLPIDKVALISYDADFKGYKFNEIRGSDVVENSSVIDSKNVLDGSLVHDVHEETLANPQDISSFPLIIPIIYEEDHEWFLALGKKNDGSIYNKNDLASFAKLVDKIKLSLKFILVYEDILNGKYEQTIQAKDQLISELQAKLNENQAKRNP